MPVEGPSSEVSRLVGWQCSLAQGYDWGHCGLVPLPAMSWYACTFTVCMNILHNLRSITSILSFCPAGNRLEFQPVQLPAGCLQAEPDGLCFRMHGSLVAAAFHHA